MSDFNAGVARGTYILSTDQAEAAGQRLLDLFRRIKAEATGLGGGGRTPSDAPVRAARNQYDAELRLAQQRARLIQLTQGNAAADRLLTQARAQSVGATERATLAVDIQQARLRQGSTAANAYGDALKNSMLGFLGPAAAVTLAIGGIATAARATEQAIRFKATLDEDRAAIGLLVSATRDQAQVLREADAFGRRYAFTQREITTALSESVTVLKASKAPTEDVLATLSRLARLNPAEGIQGAAFALGELVSGDIVSLNERFRVSRDSAREMRDAIKEGQDPVVVLSKYLDQAGVSMEVLEQRTKGTAGQMRDAAVQAERFQLALAGKAGGPGEDLLVFRTNLIKEFTAVLSGSYEEIEIRNRARAEAEAVYNAALQRGATDAQARAEAQSTYAAVIRDTVRFIDASSSALQTTADATNEAAYAAQHLGLNMDDERRATQEATEATDALAASQRGGAAAAFEQAVQIQGVSRQARNATIAMLGLRQGQIAAENQARQAANATGIQRLAGVFGRGAGRTADDLFERQAIEREREREQLASQQVRTAKAHTTELGQQLSLSESIYDSQQKQYRAALDLEELSIRNRQETRKEDEELRRLRNTAANASDPRIRAAAQDAIALIDVERRQRAAEIGEKQGVSGAPIVNGRILESLRGSAAGGSAPPTPTGGAGVPGGTAGAPGGASSSGLTIQFLVDGKLIAEVIEPQIIANALAGQRASAAGGGGLGAP